MKTLRSSGALRQGGAYGVIGGVQLVLDWLIYVLLTHLGVSVVVGNLAGRIAGAAAGFTLNGLFTFRGDDGARLGWRRFAKFLVTWAAMTVLSTAALYVIDRQLGLQASWLAKPAVDGFLAVLGFIASRYWIYR